MDQQALNEARYQRVQARLDEMAARRHAARVAARQARESTVRPATAAEFGALLDGLTEHIKRLTPITEVAPAIGTAVTESVPEQEPVKELHEMSIDELREHSRQVFDQVGERLHSPVWRGRQPMTLSQFIARGQ